ncbi:redoxin domain-containing protein [Flammeovirgaceae bacterium SG7u.111]|nr:redoxin domain-containing protein [Flammeovirgaceae bacterium SG7u.132]WPO38411.1 redoxin domain-containing protein [Flammeovirgaceae bacterium SG7u.111]
MNSNIIKDAVQLNVSAPKFKLQDIFDREIDLESYRGKKVFIAFFRHAGCPFCNLRVHRLQKVHEDLKAKGLEMIFFFESPKSALLNSTFHQEISPIPLIADPEKIWYSTYALEPSSSNTAKSHLTSFISTAIKAKLNSLPLGPPKDGESLTTMPAEFLLDEDLILRKLHYSKGLNDRIAIDHLYEFAGQKAKKLKVA